MFKWYENKHCVILGPHEKLISKAFEENQNQLVIDLATELRLVSTFSYYMNL